MNAPTWCSDFVGIPFADHGRDARGVDCWGLAILVLDRIFAIRGLPDFSARYRHSRDRALADVFAEEMRRWQRVDAPQAGDVAVYRFAGRPSHVGVVVGPGWMLNARKGAGAVLERLDAPEWVTRLDGYFRHV